MKTLNNLSLDNTFDEITIGQVTICAPSTAVYKLTLPIDTGTPGQVLTTDGNGVTSWTSGSVGSVTSVGYTATGLTGFTASGGPITGSGTLNLSYSGTAIPTLNGGTGVTGTSTGSVGVVLKNAPFISNLTTTGTTNMATLVLTNALPVTSGGTGVTTKTGTTNVVLSNGPTIDSLTLTNTTNVNSILAMNNNEILLRGSGDTAHGLGYDGVVIDGPNLHGTSGGRLSQGGGDGTARLTWDSTGTYTRGTGGSTTFLAQYQTDLTGSLDSSIAVTAGESDEAALFFGTVNVNDPTKAHKTAIIAEGQNTWGRSNLHFCINDEGNDSASATLTNSRMMIERGGNVGINTSAPATKLHVDGTTTTTFLSIDNGTATTTIATNSISNWDLTLPSDSGLSGQVLSTDGAGDTTWITQPTEPGDGTVTSVGIAVPTFLNITNSPIVTAGTMTIGLSGTPLPIANGGTGTTTETGDGAVVLANDPTINELNLTGVTGFNGNMFMNDNHVFLRNDVNHGMKWESDVNGPNIFGTDGGRLSSGGSGRVWWGPGGISTNDADYFQYSTGSWTPNYKLITDSGVLESPDSTITLNFQNGSYIRMGKKVTLFFDLGFGIDNGADRFLLGTKYVAISGLPFTCDFTQGVSNFGARQQFLTQEFPNGFAGVVPTIIASTYGSPFEAVIHGVGEQVRLAYNEGLTEHVSTSWVSDGNHILVYAANNAYEPAIATTSANNVVSNLHLLNQGYSGLRFKGTIDYFVN